MKQENKPVKFDAEQTRVLNQLVNGALGVRDKWFLPWFIGFVCGFVSAIIGQIIHIVYG